MLKDNLIDQVILQGNVGVFVFFAISGFILALPFARYHLFNSNNVSLGKYFKKRITRLEPPYIITLTLFLFVHWLLLHTESIGELIPHFIASLFYVHNIIYGEWSLINPVAWSLEIEIQFYLLAPLLTLVFAIKPLKQRRIILIMLLLLFAAFEQFLPLKEWNMSRSILSHGAFFIVGFLFVEYYLFHKEQRKKHYWSWVGFILIALLPLANMLTDWRRLLLVLQILIIFISIFESSWLNRFFSTKVITVIGGMCYITYLIHFPLAFLLAKITSRGLIGIY